MFEPLGNPSFIAEARKGKRRAGIFDMLIFLLVVSVAQFLQNFFVTSYSTVYILMDPQYLDLVYSGTPEQILTFVQEVLTRLMQGDIWYHLLMLYTSVFFILVALLYCRLIEKRRFFTMGLCKGGFLAYMRGFLLGLVMIGVAVGFAFAFRSLQFDGITGDTNIGFFLLFLVGFCIQSFAYELFFRGYLMVTLSKNMSLMMAVILSSLVYTFFGPAAAVSGIGLLNTLLLGVFLSLYTIRGGNIFGASAMHAAFLFGGYVLAGLPNAGLPSLFSLYRFIPTVSGAYINGGAYGLGGGIAVTFVLTLGIAILGMTRTKTAENSKQPKAKD